jgi:adenosylcobinamide-phosphate synthase
MSLTTLAILTALALDLLIGEPRNRLHPVAWFGRLLAGLDRDWGRPVAVGITTAAVLPIAAGGAVGFLVGALATAVPWLGVGFGGVALFLASSYRALLSNVGRVTRLAESDIEMARRELAALAGRDAAALDATRVRSAALESLAENLADGLVAPLTAAVTGAVLGRLGGVGPEWTLALACMGAVWIKAVNTMDSMWGYPDQPLGSGAARLDDVAMWLPARLTAVLLAVAFGRPGTLSRAAEWRNAVASPNAGWPMGVIAGALQVRLEKPGEYVLNPTAPYPTAAAVTAGLRHVGLAGLMAYGIAGVVAWI